MIPDDSNPAYRRIRFYQDQLDGLLDIHPDHNNLMISTWLNRWGMEPLTYEEGEEEKSTMKLGINGPEFCGGHIPLDNDPPATYTDENWRDKFLKDGSADFISNLQGNYNGSKVKVLGIHNVYLTDYGIQKGLSNYTAPSNLDTEIILNSWPFNYPVREKITEHFIGIENGETGERVTGQLRFDWGSSNVNGSNTTNIPFWNCNINAANVLGMDYKVGRSWPGHPDIDLNLRRGITDSIIGPQNQGFPGADGTYTAMGGSVAFKPCYVGFDGLSGEKGDQVFYDMRSGQYISMPPGGGSFAYRAGEQILSKLEDDPGANGEPFFLNEGFG